MHVENKPFYELLLDYSFEAKEGHQMGSYIFWDHKPAYHTNGNLWWIMNDT